VTALVLTHDRREEAVATVAHLRTLPEHPSVVVVDNGSSDGTPAALRDRFPGIEVLEVGRNLGAAGRNLGLEAARTPYVALCDDDTRWAEGSLTSAAEVLDEHPDVAIACARLLIGDDGREDPVNKAMAGSGLHKGALPGPRLLGFLAGASLVRRDPVLSAGGFSARFFLGGEEELLSIDLARRGWHVVYAPDAIVRHYPSNHRDATGREILTFRNALWTTWLRWPARPAMARTRDIVRRARRRGVAGRVVQECLRGVPWILAHRAAVDGDLAQDLVTVLSHHSYNDGTAPGPGPS
jgi:GT2 family glycosyltransferase